VLLLEASRRQSYALPADDALCISLVDEST
jgi:hypothetical protein